MAELKKITESLLYDLLQDDKIVSSKMKNRRNFIKEAMNLYIIEKHKTEKREKMESEPEKIEFQN